MSVIAEFTIDADQFLLGQLVAEHPGLTIELERLVPSSKRVMPYVWGYGADLEDFERRLAANPHVRSVRVLDRLDDRVLYRIDWEDPVEELITGLADLDATILEAHGEHSWTFRIRFASAVGLAAFHDFCTDRGIDYQLIRVHALPDDATGLPYGLTEPQYEALSAAVERGYFEVPRRVSFAELAADLGISEQALSERVRRGANTVLRQALSRSSPPPA
ncbi:MAG: helix-turn-helix domain-containing protein [Haloarculaceae archaeon]